MEGQRNLGRCKKGVAAILGIGTGMGRFSFDVDGKTDMTGGPIDEPPQKTGTVQDKAAGALKNRKIQGLTAKKAGFFTDARYGAAHIKAVRPDRVKNALSLGDIAIVAGFQGINAKGDATTLGRGGSDTSAVALAVALGADICEIYTDVDGIFTADPRIVPSARRIPSIDYESILEMASCGSKVLALRCVEYAQRFNMPLHVRSSFSRRPGTLVVPDGIDPRTLPNLD